VLPFLIRRIGAQKAHYMALTTKPIAAPQAVEWGLADACAEDSEDLLRKHLLRLRHVPKAGIRRYKAYAESLDLALSQARTVAVSTNRALFSDPEILEAIHRYTETNLFPWER
jgi:polyketide biosynthesis enoyl-CoA hydratase PksH